MKLGAPAQNVYPLLVFEWMLITAPILTDQVTGRGIISDSYDYPYNSDASKMRIIQDLEF